MLQQRWSCNSASDSQALVLPQAWISLSRYRGFRDLLLTRFPPVVVARLGEHAFRSNAAAGAFVVLLISFPRDSPRSFVALDVNSFASPDCKTEGLVRQASQCIPISGIRAQKDLRITFQVRDGGPQIEQVARSWQGISTSDFARFGRGFWEVRNIDQGWVRFQSTVDHVMPYGGRSQILFWEDGNGRITEVCQPGATFRGREAWGKLGIAVSQMRGLAATLYRGEHFDSNASMIVPVDEALVPALWCYAVSDEFQSAVRVIDQSVKVTNATLTQVPFDVERWRRVAEERFPDGLPEPWSDDPTQWLFGGRPEVASEALQVAVGRLLGFVWPEQVVPDDLDGLVDQDGIVCLPAVGGEQPAADRVMGVLAAAFGERFSPGLVRELLEGAGSSKSSLGEWLRDEFFKHHCKVFEQRPFVWHVWDGRKDGFSALVNYHRLDRGGLEKLTYTYLGDWIERQRADAEAGLVGRMCGWGRRLG
jgi:hypothetical protein